MPIAPKIEKRRRERVSPTLSAEIKAKTGKDDLWKQKTELISVSRSGAGFYLQRECAVGQLVSLMLPMPKHLRCYDPDKELYRVWGLVQHCSRIAAAAAGASYHVGVAFVGKHAPASYHENPHQSYRVIGINEDGTWRIDEAQTAFVVRKHPRFSVAITVFLSAQDEHRNVVTDEIATTENISLSGAAVFSQLPVNIGDSVNFDCLPFNFSTLAIVRNRQTSDAAEPRLHLEFINADFPIEEVCLPAVDESDKEFKG